MTPADVRRDVRAILAETTSVVPDDDGAPLELDSFAVVSTVEAIEDRFGVRVKPAEVRPEHFATVTALVAFVQTKVGT